MDSTIWENVDKRPVNTGVGIDVSKESFADTYQDDETSWDIIQKVTRDEDQAIRIMGVDTLKPHDDHSHSLLEWHIRLGHLSMKRIQALASVGKLPRVLAKCKVPLCTGCFFGRLTRQPWRHKGEHKHIAVKSQNPGDCISVDQMNSSIPGLVGQLKGSPTRKRYRVATVFVDHMSDYTYVFMQTDDTSEQTLLAKREFERHALGMGVHIKKYHADNGRFIDNAWVNHLKLMNQSMSLCGVNAHHQNGIVEKRIRDLQELSRSSILHAQKMWPDAINTFLWPYAVRYAARNMNYLKKWNQEQSPVEMFAGTAMDINVKTFHTFGCPMYVLLNNQQGAIKGAKWDEKARMAIYLGNSDNHASNVGLALSIHTGMLSPAFHVKYDDQFLTVRDPYGKYIDKSKWQIKCGFSESVATEPWVKQLNTENITDTNTDILPTYEQKNLSNDAYNETMEDTSDLQIPTIDDNVSEDISHDIQATVEVPTVVPEATVPVTTRSGRQVRTPTKYKDFVVYETTISDNGEEEIENDSAHPLAYMTTGGQDNFYYHEILKEVDKEQFIDAMKKEIEEHNTNGNWIPMLRSSIPEGVKVIPSVWAMRRKRDLCTGKINKWKARLNVDGSKQVKGVNFWETYAPVAQWATIRLVMSMVSINRWKVKTFDFVQAFPQAPSEAELYIDVPRGCNIDGDRDKWCLKVVNNIYGQKQAGRVWYRFLTDKLINELEFKQSKHDPCLLWKNGCIIVIYTDDTIIVGPDTDVINDIISSVESLFKITSSDSVDDFLGVNISYEEDGKISYTQPKLIQSILDDLGLKDDSVTKEVPALSTKILHKHKDSLPFNEPWHYRSVIGKLNYLEKSTRPDIAYAVHQCARYSSDPRFEHGKAVKQIGRYLLNTKDKGIHVTPKCTSLECYADADYSGEWDPNTITNDRDSARSRTGYIIKYAGVPIVWASRLQTEIAMSSTESEYIALSTALREAIPMVNFLQELFDEGFDFQATNATILCTAFEDNEGALEMARTPKFRPRTKHINIKYHHFHDSIDDGKINMQGIDTKQQQADIFTKPLAIGLFEYLRKLIMGW
jgi:Reverse transcriptase (RNA-dependent DNA polymerase)